MRKLIDLTGQKFGKLLVLERGQSIRRKCGTLLTMWKCKCDCGKIVEVQSQLLRNGHAKSCGCLKHFQINKIEDLTGMRFGFLTVIKLEEFNPVRWECRCDCGNIKTILGTELRKGNVKSCGCKKSYLLKQANTTHNSSHSRLYNVWQNMIRRCEDKKSTSYKNYGSRGIGVCEEWKDYSSFAEWSYENGYDETAKRGECTLDRIDNDGNYCPENCQWANRSQQQRNKRTNTLIEHGGETKTIVEWSEITGISEATISARLRRGIDDEHIFFKGRLRNGNKTNINND